MVSSERAIGFSSFNKYFGKFRGYLLSNCFFSYFNSNVATDINNPLDVRENSSFGNFLFSKHLGNGKGSFVEHGVIDNTGLDHSDGLS
jgi:hypothetical protein